MKHEALVHTVAMLLSAAIGLAAGGIFAVPGSDYLINGALAAMLYFVFVCIDGKALSDAFRNHRFTATSLIVNFVWTPFFAFGLGCLFFGGDIDIRIGLLLCLAAPCTDWYLVFTSAAKGDMAVSGAILPLNLILQIILVPVYLLLLFGAEIRMDSFEPVAMSLMTLVLPLLLAFIVRKVSFASPGANKVREASERNANLGQIVFLCLAVFLMFMSCSSEIEENLPTLVRCVVPLLVFFVSTTFISLAVSSALGWGEGQSTSLIFTALARNSPLILAMMSSLFQDQPLVLAVLVICPLVELPFLSVMSYLRGRRSDATKGM